MTSFADPVQSTTRALYGPTLPYVVLTPRLETVTNEVFRQSLEAAKTETSRLLPLVLVQNWKEKIVTGIARGTRRLYVDKQRGAQMARLITQNFWKGKYEGYTHPFTIEEAIVFKNAILHDLRSIYPDKHLDLVCSEQRIPEYDPDRSLRTLTPEELTPEQRTYLEALQGDRPDFSKKVAAYMIPQTKIGYFKIDLFPSLECPETQPIIDQAMKKIVHAEALIIDLRGNNGGSPATVAFVASYLFDQRQLLNQLYQRSNNKLTSFYAEPEKLDQVFGGQKPIYVLTSQHTFSAAEELAYDLQSSKRAKVVGQATAGGAHSVRALVVDDRVFMQIPFAEAIHPRTKTNWEGTGVVPDYLIEKEKDALAFARTLMV